MCVTFAISRYDLTNHVLFDTSYNIYSNDTFYNFHPTMFLYKTGPKHHSSKIFKSKPSALMLTWEKCHHVRDLHVRQ